MNTCTTLKPLHLLSPLKLISEKKASCSSFYQLRIVLGNISLKIIVINVISPSVSAFFSGGLVVGGSGNTEEETDLTAMID